MKRLEAIVAGKVQGVTYREFVARTAKRLHLVGEVENLFDGTVRVVVEGESALLDALITELVRGPFFADVRNVATSFTPAHREFKEFTIRR